MPEKPTREPLTRARVIEAALTLIDENGVDGLTMRRLGQRLRVDPMAVYYHLPNKTAVLDGIVELLWQSVELPPVTPGETWRSVLYDVFDGFRSRLLEHPRAVVVIGTRPATTPALLSLIDRLLGRLDDVGLDAGQAMALIDCLSGYTVGKVLAEIAEPVGGPSDTVARALAEVTPASHPRLVSAMASGIGFAPDREFELGLRALLAGWAPEPVQREGTLRV